jgi:hypothetical protein
VNPFDTWYSTNIAPTIPKDAPVIVKKLSREMMAACWNAALDAADKWLDDPTARIDGSAFIDANGIEFGELRARG